MGTRHSGQVYLPTEIQELLKESGRISPSCRLYPPACKPSGLEAEPEAEFRSWVGEKTPVKMRDIVTAVSEIYHRSAGRRWWQKEMFDPEEWQE
jgi:hypothetical protein